MSLEQDILGVLQAKAAALVARDRAAFERLLHPDFCYVNSRGAVLGKDRYITQFTSGQLKFESQTFENLSVHDYGAVAVCSVTVHDRITMSGSTSNATLLSMCVFERSPGGWRWCAGQTMYPRL